MNIEEATKVTNLIKRRNIVIEDIKTLTTSDCDKYICYIPKGSWINSYTTIQLSAKSRLKIIELAKQELTMELEEIDNQIKQIQC